jgi:hypothetical protein
VISRRLRFGLRGLALGLLVAVPVSADHPGAPVGQYELFASSDRRIKDLKTGLIWERSVSAAPVAFDPKVCSTAGLRLPTLKELLTLVDEQPDLDYDIKLLRNVEKMIDPQAFGAETPVDAPYWTSSRQGPGRVWTVDFRTGRTAHDSESAQNYIRCVSFQP